MSIMVLVYHTLDSESPDWILLITEIDHSKSQHKSISLNKSHITYSSELLLYKLMILLLIAWILRHHHQMLNSPLDTSLIMHYSDQILSLKGHLMTVFRSRLSLLLVDRDISKFNQFVHLKHSKCFVSLTNKITNLNNSIVC